MMHAGDNLLGGGGEEHFWLVEGGEEYFGRGGGEEHFSRGRG